MTNREIAENLAETRGVGESYEGFVSRVVTALEEAEGRGMEKAAEIVAKMWTEETYRGTGPIDFAAKCCEKASAAIRGAAKEKQ